MPVTGGIAPLNGGPAPNMHNSFAYGEVPPCPDAET
jgi:hypothetical protein